MKCPVCGTDCIKSPKEILGTLPTIFSPCGGCSMRVLDKRSPPPSLDFGHPCSCGKRFIDEIFVHMFAIMVEEGDLNRTDPLISVGSPLIHPGFVMDHPPFLPGKSLVLLTSRATRKTAERLIEEVPELKGVIRKENFIPGIADPGLSSVPRVYELLAGCDVRADIFPLKTGPLVIYKQQSKVHVEFPRADYPKIHAVERHVGTPPVNHFVDACAGVGTLGLTAACLGVAHVVLNDAWYASAFWAAFNLEINREYLRISKVRVFEQEEEMREHPVAREPIKIAETEGDQIIEVYQGDFRKLYSVLATGNPPVTVFDLFEKKDSPFLRQVLDEWALKVGGDVFIP
jgi:hypothetical protein